MHTRELDRLRKLQSKMLPKFQSGVRELHILLPSLIAMLTIRVLTAWLLKATIGIYLSRWVPCKGGYMLQTGDMTIQDALIFDRDPNRPDETSEIDRMRKFEAIRNLNGLDTIAEAVTVVEDSDKKDTIRGTLDEPFIEKTHGSSTQREKAQSLIRDYSPLPSPKSTMEEVLRAVGSDKLGKIVEDVNEG